MDEKKLGMENVEVKGEPRADGRTWRNCSVGCVLRAANDSLHGFRQGIWAGVVSAVSPGGVMDFDQRGAANVGTVRMW